MPRMATPEWLGFEEQSLALLLAALGTLGVVLGLLAPRDHPTELVLGALLAGTGAWTFFANRREARRSRTRDA